MINVVDGGKRIKSALKRVSFAEDTKEGAPIDETTSLLQIEPENEMQTGKVVVAGSDVTVEALTQEPQAISEKGEEAAGDEEPDTEEAAFSKRKVHPIDVNTSLRESLKRLTTALKADTSSASIGIPVIPEANGSAGAAETGAREESASEEEESEEDEDELEFDFESFGTKAGDKKGRKKHGQRTGAGAASPRIGTKGSDLRASLSGLSAAVSAQTYMATSASFSNSFKYSGLGSDPNASSTTDEQNKTGSIGVVKAEIRALKGLLLSR